jgi:hypothetical protein
MLEKFTKNQIIIAATILLAAVIVAAFLLWPKASSGTFRSDDITFQYPNGYIRDTSLDKNTDEGERIVTLTRDEPAGYISVNKAGNAEEAANTLKISQLDYLEKNAELKMSTAYKGYERLAIERDKLDSYDSQTITFSYTGGDDKTKIFMNYIMVPVRENILYISIQSTDKSQLEKDTKVVTESIDL